MPAGAIEERVLDIPIDDRLIKNSKTPNGISILPSIEGKLIKVEYFILMVVKHSGRSI